MSFYQPHEEHPHCTYCGACWDQRSTLRFWYIGNEPFCEDCAADVGKEMLDQLWKSFDERSG